MNESSELLARASKAMYQDPDPRWHPVATWLESQCWRGEHYHLDAAFVARAYLGVDA